jgi:hypothetical protein
MLNEHGDTLCCTKSIPRDKGNRQWCGQTGVVKINGAVRCAKHCGKAPFGWTVVARGGGQTDSSKDIIYVYKRDCPATGLAADLAPFTHATKVLAEAAGARGEYAYKRKPLCRIETLHAQGIFDDQAGTEAEQADIADGCERCIADAPSP